MNMEATLKLLEKALLAIKSFVVEHFAYQDEVKTPLIPLDLPVSRTDSPKVVEVPQKPVYDWSTRETTRKSCRMVMDEFGLTWKEKDLLCAVIKGESAFDIYSKNDNKKNGKVLSTDWGICQINDFYHVGQGKSFPSVQYILDNPDECVRFMVRMYKLGHLDWWIAYRNGSWKKYI